MIESLNVTKFALQIFLLWYDHTCLELKNKFENHCCRCNIQNINSTIKQNFHQTHTVRQLDLCLTQWLCKRWVGTCHSGSIRCLVHTEKQQMSLSQSDTGQSQLNSGSLRTLSWVGTMMLAHLYMTGMKRRAEPRMDTNRKAQRNIRSRTCATNFQSWTT